MSSVRAVKKQKLEQQGTELLVEIPIVTPGGKVKLLRALVDTGSSGCIILNEFTLGMAKTSNSITRWTTKGGDYQTNMKCKVTFTFPEFDMNSTVNWEFHVGTETSASSSYDMIIGRDLLFKMGMGICFSSKTIQWNGLERPMRPLGELKSQGVAHHIYQNCYESALTQATSSRVNKILDAEYRKLIF